MSGSLGQIFECLSALLFQLLCLQLQRFQLILQLLLLLSGSLLLGAELLFGLPHAVQQQLMLFGLCGERRKLLLQFPQLNRGLFSLLFRVAHAVCQISALLGDFLQLFALHTDFRLPLLQLIGARQNTRRSARRAARHGAARVDELPIACDNAEAVAVLSGNCQRTVHILRHNGSAESIVHDVAVIRFTFDQIRRHAAKARLMFQSGFAQRLRTNRIHRQKCRAAAVTALEHLNGFFAVFRTLDNDIGSSCTQRRFHRCDIAIRHMDE